MPFFLLGRSPEGAIILLSDDAMPTRKAALAELARITADPDFPHWDHEVFVMDLDAGTPVLLVRPTVEKRAEEPEVAEELEVASVEPEMADEPAEEILETLVVEADVEAEPESEPEPEPEFEPEADIAEEIVAENVEVPLVEPELEPEADIAAESEPEITPEPEVPVEDDISSMLEDLVAEDEEPVSLKDALRRTTEHMEAQGIIAPDSIQPAEELEPEVDAALEPELAEPEPEVPAQQAPAAAGWPWDTAPAQAAVQTNPQDATPDDVARVLDALEEPSIADEGPLLRTTIDDETFDAVRPVVLGSYGEGGALIEENESPMEPAAEAVSQAAPAEQPDEISDFILDLESTPAPAPVASDESPVVDMAPGVDPAAAEALASMTCQDCVYVNTCPNKDQRDPRSCGSFQWK